MTLELIAGLRLETGQEWAAVADPLQLSDATAVLDPEPDHRRHWLGRPRGWSKTTDAAAFTIGALLSGLIGPRERGYCCAADRDQAALLVAAIAGFTARTPDLRGALDVETWRVTNRDTGASVVVLASDAASAHGLRSGWWVVDELAAWDDTPNSVRFWEAVSTAWPKDPRSRVVVISTAGRPGGFAHGVYKYACEAPSWRMSETHIAPPWLDPEEIEAERRRLPEPAFLRYWRNEWVQGSDRMLDPADVEAAVVLDGPLDREVGRSYCVGVDLGVRRDRSAVLTGHLERPDVRDVSPPLVVDRLDVSTPTSGRDVDLQAVEELIEARAHQFSAPVIFDPAHGFQMMARLRKRGIRVIEHTFSAASNGRRTLLLLQVVRERRLRIPDDRELVDELLNLRLKETSLGTWRYDHDSGRHDDRVTALSLVAFHLFEHLGGPARSSGQSMAGRVLPPVPLGERSPSVASVRRLPRRLRSVQEQIGGYRPQHDDPKGAA